VTSRREGVPSSILRAETDYLHELTSATIRDCEADLRRELQAIGWTGKELPVSEAQKHNVAESVPNDLPVSPKTEEEFRHNDDYSTIHWKGHRHTLTPNQRAMVKALDRARETGNAPMSGKDLVKAAGLGYGTRVRDSWKGSKALWKKLIVSPRKGFYGLNLGETEPSEK
jgi:hypothetical protein